MPFSGVGAANESSLKCSKWLICGCEFLMRLALLNEAPGSVMLDCDTAARNTVLLTDRSGMPQGHSNSHTSADTIRDC